VPSRYFRYAILTSVEIVMVSDYTAMHAEAVSWIPVYLYTGSVGDLYCTTSRWSVLASDKRPEASTSRRWEIRLLAVVTVCLRCRSCLSLQSLITLYLPAAVLLLLAACGYNSGGRGGGYCSGCNMWLLTWFCGPVRVSIHHTCPMYFKLDTSEL